MTCETARELLDDALEGELGERDQEQLRLHLETCADCRDEEQALRSLVARARALPRERRPARDLWPGIATRLPAARSSASNRSRPWLPVSLAAAAAVVVSLASFESSRAGRAGREVAVVAVAQPEGAAPAGTPVPVSLTAGPPALLDAERDYARATSELLAAIESRRGSLPKETLQTIEKNMLLIDQALAGLRAALASAPENRDLTELLAATHKRKLDTLRRVARLSKI